MKNIFNPIAVSATLFFALVGGLTASAQKLDPGTYQEENGVCFRKSAEPVSGTVDQYTIQLEAFVLGNVTITKTMRPADIALVLDVSGSMLAPLPGTYTTASSVSYSNVRDGKSADVSGGSTENKGYKYYYKDGDAYYQLSTYTGSHPDPSGYNSTTRYFLRYSKGGSNYYLSANGPVQLTTLTSGTGSTIRWTSNAVNCSKTGLAQNFVTNQCVIYRDQSKLEALKEASEKFVNNVVYNDTHDADGNEIESVGHQIAIVSFASSAKTEFPFSAVSNEESVSSAVEAIRNLTTGSSTQTGLGMTEAVQKLTAISGRDDASKVVVLFTDGTPGVSTFDTNVANTAISQAKIVKDMTDSQGKKTGSVYSIGLIENPDSQTVNFMNYVSSNYPGATSMTNAGTKDSDKYYKLASGADLSDIFSAIADEASGGAENTSVSSESAVTVDVVSTSFNIPALADGSYDVSVKIAPVSGQFTHTDGKTYLLFGDAKNATEYGLPAIGLDGDALSEGIVRTSGFDYSAHYCYYVDEEHMGGYKQIISFNIKANEDAVGGPEVTTNDSSSGIYIDDPDNPGEKKQIATFNQPTVKVPVQIWIAKKGLVGSDNAVFTIYYADPEDAENVGKSVDAYTWNHFTKVAVNNGLTLKYNDNGTEIPMVKVVGLDPDFVYRIKEDVWSWSYTPEVGTMYTAPLQKGDIISNPFIFVNVPRENLKEVEHGVRNVFNPGTGSNP